MLPHSKLITALRRHLEIELAYLFGSAAKGKKAPQDVDVAILLSKPLKVTQKLNYIVKLCTELEKTSPAYTFDITILNTADPLLAFQVIQHGKLLVERHKKADRDFKVRTMTRYHDAKPLHDFFFKRAMENVAKSLKQKSKSTRPS